MPSTVEKGAISVTFVCPFVCLSRTRQIIPERRGSVHTFETKVPHLRCDSHTSFNVKRPSGLQTGGGIPCRPNAAVTLLFTYNNTSILLLSSLSSIILRRRRRRRWWWWWLWCRHESLSLASSTAFSWLHLALQRLLLCTSSMSLVVDPDFFRLLWQCNALSGNRSPSILVTCLNHVSHLRLGFTWIDIFFAKICAKTIFVFPLPSDLDLEPFNLKIALPVTNDVGNLFSKFDLVDFPFLN